MALSAATFTDVDTHSVEVPTRRWTFEMARVGDLKVDHRYHDPARYKEKRAQVMATSFNVDKVGTVTISERSDGSRWIIDGQHRCSAARIAGVPLLPARVFRGLSLAEEAEIFYGLSEFVRLRPEAQWRARIEMGDTVAIGVVGTLAHHGCRLVIGGSTRKDPTTTRSFSAVETLHRADMLHTVLRIVRSAWPEDQHSLDAYPLWGVGSFLRVYASHPRYSEARLIEKLAEFPASSVIRQTKELMSLGVNSGGRLGTGGGHTGQGKSSDSLLAQGSPRRAILATYNRRLRHPLPDVGISDLRAMSAGRNIWG